MSFDELKQKFYDLSPRDQLMLLVLAAGVLLYLLHFVLYEPMRDELESERKRVLAVKEEQARVRSLAAQALALQQSGGELNHQNINSILNDTSREFGLRMENFQPSGSAVRVRLASADFNRVLAWLHELEIKQGLQIRDLNLTADDQPGAVIANVQVEQGE